MGRGAGTTGHLTPNVGRGEPSSGAPTVRESQCGGRPRTSRDRSRARARQHRRNPDGDSAPFIDGQWIDSTGTTAIDTIDPATGLVIDEVPTASGADVDAAVAAARAALTKPAWAGLLPVQRAGLLFRLAALMEEHHEELAQLETRDQGQPIGISRMVSVGGAAEHFRYYAGWVTKIQGSTNPVLVPGHPALHATRAGRGHRSDHALELPADDPLRGSWRPALATGNTVVIKPSEVTPLTSLRLVELCAEAGFPPGVVNIVTGDG